MNFFSFFVKLTIATCAILIVLLFLVGGLLIWKPEVIVTIIRYGIAAGCFIGGGLLLVRLLIALITRK